MSLRLLVCGGRDFTDGDAVFYVLDRIHRERGIAFLMQGEAAGADAFAKAWARQATPAVDWTGFKAFWRRADGSIDYGAGLARNARMLAEGRPNACVAFQPGPKGKDSGTADMVRKCEAAGVPVWRIGWT